MAQAELFTDWIVETALDGGICRFFPTATNTVANASRALGGRIIR